MLHESDGHDAAQKTQSSGGVVSCNVVSHVFARALQEEEIEWPKMKAPPKERKEPKAKAKAKAEPKAKAAASSSETSGAVLPAADVKRFLSRASYTIANSKNEEERAAAESAVVEYRAAETREQKRSILERLQDCDGKFKFTGHRAPRRH